MTHELSSNGRLNGGTHINRRLPQTAPWFGAPPSDGDAIAPCALKTAPLAWRGQGAVFVTPPICRSGDTPQPPDTPTQPHSDHALRRRPLRSPAS
eukprot:scaffold5483_cov39-Phaeocystis_antarctica.AAC.2